MTPEQRIAQLEAELARERAELAREKDTVRRLLAIVESNAQERAAAAVAKSRRSERNARHRAKTSQETVRETSQETHNETSRSPSPSSSPPPSFSLSPPSTPSPSILYPFSPAFPPSPPAASQAQAAAAPPPGEELPDATDDAQPVADERPALVLHVQPAGKKPRATPAGEALYIRLETSRRKVCEDAGVPFVESRWAYGRQNKELGAIARLEAAGGAEWARFRDAWAEFISDDSEGGPRYADVPWPLEWFLKHRSRYEGRALKAAGGEA